MTNPKPITITAFSNGMFTTIRNARVTQPVPRAPWYYQVDGCDLVRTSFVQDVIPTSTGYIVKTLNTVYRVEGV